MDAALLEHLLHARTIGDVSRERQPSGARDAGQRLLRTGNPDDLRSLRRQELDHRAPEVPRAEDDHAAATLGAHRGTVARDALASGSAAADAACSAARHPNVIAIPIVAPPAQ